MARIYRRQKDGHWIADYTDAAGVRQRVSTKTANKTVATRILDQLKLEAATGRFNVSGSDKALSSLVDEYISFIGRTGDKHQRDTEHRIRRVIEPNGWTRARQITQYDVEITVQQLTSKRQGGKLSLRSQAHYLTAIKGFTNWLVNVRRALKYDPLANTKKPNWDHDRKLVRRFLLPEEWTWLSKTNNAVLYATAIETGFRASEIQKLSKSSIKDDHLFLPAKYTKNKKDARQYISPQLRKALAKQLPFTIEHRDYLADLLRSDLAKARAMAQAAGPIDDDFLVTINSSNHTLDFHALRHTCGAWLAMKGINPKAIQKVMRHSTIRLTLDTYGHLLPDAERDAAAVLAGMLYKS